VKPPRNCDRGNTADVLAQGRTAKAPATDAIVAAGGSITHHHGV